MMGGRGGEFKLFNAAGAETVELSAEEVTGNGAQIVLRVADNGNGIPPHMLERVFDMFTQLEAPGGRLKDGLGIGLALVKRLVAMHNGEIEARSDAVLMGCFWKGFISSLNTRGRIGLALGRAPGAEAS